MLLEFLNVTLDLPPVRSEPLVCISNVPATIVLPDTDSTVNLLVLNCNVEPLYVNKLSPIVLSEDAIGNVPLVKLVSLPNVPAVVPITLLELLEPSTVNQLSFCESHNIDPDKPTEPESFPVIPAYLWNGEYAFTKMMLSPISTVFD